MSNLVKKIDFAKICGVTPAAVTKATAGPLKPALVGKRIDINHPLVRDYMQDRDITIPKIRQKEPSKLPPRDPVQKSEKRTYEDILVDIPEDLHDYLQWTLIQIYEKFGTIERFDTFLDAVKTIEMVEDRRIKNAKSAGVLVSRELIRIGIVEPIDRAFHQLLTDGAKTMNMRIHTMIKSGSDEEETEKMVIDNLTSFIKPLKSKMKRELRKIVQVENEKFDTDRA